MKTVNIHEAKTHFSKLLEGVNAGEIIVIAKAGKPIAKLIPFAETSSRTAGALAGQIIESADAWEPDEELTVALEGGSIFPDPAPINRVAEDPSSHS